MTETQTYPLPPERLERRMPDAHPLMSAQQALAESNRCLYCHDAPCIAACPTAIDIPEFIRKIATGNVKASARTILDANILGLSCARVCPVEVLCAGACVYNHLDRPPIEIGRLQRYATEISFDRGYHFHKAGPRNGKRVACVGAGPASLACAAELAQMGYEVTLLEGRDLPGGLNTTGVAPYKLFAEDSLREVRYILDIGNIAIETGRWISKDGWADLASRYDAVFIGVGLGKDGRMRVPGEDAKGVMGATALIELLKNRPASELGWLSSLKRAVVVGGGNTSVDVVRELRKLGVPQVTLVYRRSESEIPAYAHEVALARQEGVQLLCHAQPVEVLSERGEARALRVIRTRTVPQGEGRARLESIPGAELDLPADLVVAAIGQEMLEELLTGVPDLTLEKGRVVVDPRTGQTTNPRFFSGGDCANGGKEVVNASAEGKRAAHGIDTWLRSPRGPA